MQAQTASEATSPNVPYDEFPVLNSAAQSGQAGIHPKRSLDRAVGINRPDQVSPPDRILPWISVHAGCFNEAVSIGIFLRRLPVAAKIALATAGTIAEVPGSPIPPGGSELLTMWTSMAGASFMRRIW